MAYLILKVSIIYINVKHKQVHMKPFQWRCSYAYIKRVLHCGSDLTCVGLPVNSHVNTCSSCDVTRLLKDRHVHRSTFAGNMAFCAHAVPSASVQTVHDWVCLTMYWAFRSYTISEAILLFSKRCTVATSVTRVISMYTSRASRFQYSSLR